MILDRNVLVPMRDGATLSANVFRPEAQGRFPVLMTFGPYGKDVPLREFMPAAWDLLQERYPEILARSSGKHLVWETPDPEAWVDDGYVLVRVDARGAGKSPGRLDPNSPAEFRDFYDAIVWAGEAPWSSGKVGLTGISYHAAGQWRVAALKPPYLTALLPWQGTYDFYADRTRQDGIFSSGFTRRWWSNSVLRNQHGDAASPYHDLYTGGRTNGDVALSAAELANARADYVDDVLAHPLNDAWYRERTPDLSLIDLPTLVVANWGGLALHLRGTIGGYCGIASRAKWLKVQAGSYIHTYLQPQNVALQKRFFDRFLKDAENGFESEPEVEIEIRASGDRVHSRLTGASWPLPQTQWTTLFLDARAKDLRRDAPAAAARVSYAAMSAGATFTSAPFAADTIFAGPAVLRLQVESNTRDMDLFVTLCAFAPDGEEITFRSFAEPKAPVSQGWLRVSQRKTDPARSTPYRPFRPHDTREPLVPGEVYQVDVEIWPLSLFLPKGSRLAIVVQGKDFERPGPPGTTHGVGWMTHDDPADRPATVFAGTHTLHTGGGRESWLLLPVIPAK